jgi:hypothetical protein
MQNLLLKARAGRRQALLFRSLRRGRDLVVLEQPHDTSENRTLLAEQLKFQPLAIPQYMTMPNGHRYSNRV